MTTPEQQAQIDDEYAQRVAARQRADDELSLEIGRVARAYVDLDRMVRILFYNLARPGLGQWLANDVNGVAAKIDSCCIMLSRASDIPGDLKEAGLDALKAAKDANKVRNDVVHDHWQAEFDVASGAETIFEWTLGDRKRGGINDWEYKPKDIEFVSGAHTNLRRAVERLMSLATLVHDHREWAASDIDIETRDERYEPHLRVVRGKFEFTAGGGIRYT